VFFPRPIAWVVLTILLAASAGAWFIARKQADRRKVRRGWR
jgi:hypothetical protein